MPESYRHAHSQVFQPLQLSQSLPESFIKKLYTEIIDQSADDNNGNKSYHVGSSNEYAEGGSRKQNTRNTTITSIFNEEVAVHVDQVVLGCIVSVSLSRWTKIDLPVCFRKDQITH